MKLDLFHWTNPLFSALFLTFVLAFLIVGLTLAGILIPGNLDPTLDVDGKVTTTFGTNDDIGQAVVVQDDGKLVVAGYTDVGANADFAVVRYLSDGSLDETFDDDGFTSTPIGAGNDFGKAMALQSDGKLLVAGYSHNGSNFDYALARYETDGALDSTFDGDGKVTTPVGNGYDAGNALVVQNDGKIVVAGFSHNGNDYDFSVARYDTDGGLDESFDTDGLQTTPIGDGNDRGRAVALQSDGKIIVVGDSDNGTDADVALIRYNTDGSLDDTFDADGIVTTTVGVSQDFGYAVAIQSNGQIVVAGYSDNGSDYDFSVLRYNTDGSPDNTFDTDGMVTTPIGPGNDIIFAIALQNDDKIVVAGYSYNGNLDFALAVYNDDGSLDNSFDTDGITTTPIGNGNDEGYAMAIQGDGKYVVAGYSDNVTNNNFALIRFFGLTQKHHIYLPSVNNP